MLQWTGERNRLERFHYQSPRRDGLLDNRICIIGSDVIWGNYCATVLLWERSCFSRPCCSETRGGFYLFIYLFSSFSFYLFIYIYLFVDSGIGLGIWLAPKGERERATDKQTEIGTETEKRKGIQRPSPQREQALEDVWSCILLSTLCLARKVRW